MTKWTIPADTEVERLREALTLIERVYHMEGKGSIWRAAIMNGIARTAQDGEDLTYYRRLFPRAVLSGPAPGEGEP